MMVEDWEYSFRAPPLAAVPSEVFASEKTLSLNRSTLHLKYYGPAHTDSDIPVAFHLLCAVDSPGSGAQSHARPPIQGDDQSGCVSVSSSSARPNAGRYRPKFNSKSLGTP